MSYTVDWIPIEPILFTASSTDREGDYYISATVTASGGGPSGASEGGGTGPTEPPPSITHYSVVGNPKGVVITNESSRIVVSIDNLTVLFTTGMIKYLLVEDDPSSLRMSQDWDTIPLDVTVVEFLPSRVKTVTQDIIVTAHLDNGDTSSMKYSMVVHQNWTSGKYELDRRSGGSSN